MTNGVSTDLNNDLNVYNYEKVITENEISTEITTIATPDSENHISGKICVIAVLPVKSDSDFMFCLQTYQGLIIDRSLVY